MKQIYRLFLVLSISLIFNAVVFSQVTNNQCFQCHSNVSLKKDVTVSGGTETIPLYVDSTLFKTNLHKNLKCVDCHTDITTTNLYTHASGGTNGLQKYYGSWARFSKSDTTLNADNSPRTRNYYTAASKSCANSTCHNSHSGFENSNHSMITRLKSARVHKINGEDVGENYDKGCSRCHTTCGTCHFKTNLVQKYQGNLLDIWGNLHAEGEGNYPNAGAMSEWAMDWTTNVASHEFITGEQLKSSNDVCRSCHVGYYRPPVLGFITDKEPYTKAKATNIKRHPQYYEQSQSSAHGNLYCGNCHSNVHSYPGREYDWQAEGDVKCQSCHVLTNHYAQHTTVDCISCHATGFGRSQGLGDDVHDVFRALSNNRVRPLAVKYNEGLSWYPHNIEKPNTATLCAAKCHYSGNLLGATVITDVLIADVIPSKYSLEQNFPNPFNPNTNITFALPKESHVKLDIYSITGELVKTLVNDNLKPGKHTLTLQMPKNTSSGIYFYRLTANQYSETRKMILLK
ncbi:MAG: T9SS type A sorting domain-containing protein [Ignavibacteriales bacterium]|nr:T9SS type A sorting domain-containing protein [Ignavibacteriales bacterium]